MNRVIDIEKSDGYFVVKINNYKAEKIFVKDMEEDSIILLLVADEGTPLNKKIPLPGTLLDITVIEKNMNLFFKQESIYKEKIPRSINYISKPVSSDPEKLLLIKSKELVKIKEIVTSRKINYLVHFTRIENLNSILENGLIPVKIQEEMLIPSIHNDVERMDAKVECTSCSVSFPNYKLFYNFRMHFFKSNWVVILLNKDILFSPSNITYFCYTNAARVFPAVKNEMDLKKLCMANAFENMFCDYFTTKDNKSISRSSLQISDNYTTDPQAEILISSIIDKKYIEYICFSQHSDIDKFIAKHGNDLLNKYRYNIYEDFFTFRNDYEFWKKEN